MPPLGTTSDPPRESTKVLLSVLMPFCFVQKHASIRVSFFILTDIDKLSNRPYDRRMPHLPDQNPVHPGVTNTHTEVTAAILTASAAAAGAPEAEAQQIAATLTNPDKPGDYED